MRINLYLTPSASSTSNASRGSHAASTSTTVSLPASPGLGLGGNPGVPAPLLALSPNGELILIELQGSLEMEGLDLNSGGQVVGEFSWLQGKEERPSLLLSHHRLEGKLTTLPRPLAVLEKRKRRGGGGGGSGSSRKQERNAVSGEQPLAFSRPLELHPPSPTPLMCTMSRNPLLEDSDDEETDTLRNDDGGGGAKERGRASLSPTVLQRRRKHLEDGAESGIQEQDQGPSATSASSLGPLHKKSKADTSDIRTPARPAVEARSAADVPSSSPAPLPPMRGSALDFSSPQPQGRFSAGASADLLSSSPTRSGLLRDEHGQDDDDDDDEKEEEEEEGEEGDGVATPTQRRALARPAEDRTGATDMSGSRPAGRQTSTYYQIVCVVRKKVLFSKRPEPVVHGLGGGVDRSEGVGASASASGKVEVR